MTVTILEYGEVENTSDKTGGKRQKEPDLLVSEGRMALGYGLIPKMPMQDQRLTIEAKAIYSYFCSFAGAGAVAFPSRDKVLYDLKIGKTRYYTNFKLLQQFGFIGVDQQKDEAGHFTRNIYTLIDDIKAGEKRYNEKKNAENKPSSPCIHFPDTDDHNENKPFSPCTYCPDTDSRYTDGEDTIINNVKNNNFKSNSRQQQPAPLKRPSKKKDVVVVSEPVHNPEWDITSLDFIQEPLTDAQKAAVLNAYKGDAERIRANYQTAQRQGGVRGIVGWLIAGADNDIIPPVEIKQPARQNRFNNTSLKHDYDYAALERLEQEDLFGGGDAY